MGPFALVFRKLAPVILFEVGGIYTLIFNEMHNKVNAGPAMVTLGVVFLANTGWALMLVLRVRVWLVVLWALCEVGVAHEASE